VQDSPDRGDMQETSGKTSKIDGSEVQDSPNRGDVQETSDETSNINGVTALSM
jgi:hypothetical protein